MSETIEIIRELVAIGRAHGRTHQISTVNVDFLVNALDDAAVASILQHADVCIPDGMPVVWGSRMLGMPVRERVAGADLVPILIAESERAGWHVHVFGSTPAVAKAAEALLRERHPNARFSIDPGPIIADVNRVDQSVLDSIAAVDADILCVALGNPKQEHFIAAHRDQLKVPVMIGVGGSLDMLVGKRRRAPAWMQERGLEWIVRALQEPRRLGMRYARDIRVFTPAILSAWGQCRRRRYDAGLRWRRATDHLVEVELSGTEVLTMEDWQSVASEIADGVPLVIHASSVRPASDRALAQLIGLIRLARRHETTVQWLTHDGAPPQWLESFGMTCGAVTSPPR